MSSSEDLEHVYGASTPEGVRKAYDAWANGYDAENIAKGYRLSAIGAAFAARHVARDAHILDAGCGTGLVGEALFLLGFTRLTGTDLSPQMLKAAGSRALYDRLFPHELGIPLPDPADSYDAATLFGALGPGHAPAHALNDLIRVVRPGGHVIFNTRADTADAQGLTAHMADLTHRALWRETDRSPVFRPFLLAEPAVTTQVFVFEVA